MVGAAIAGMVAGVVCTAIFTMAEIEKRQRKIRSQEKLIEDLCEKNIRIMCDVEGLELIENKNAPGNHPGGS